VTIGIVLDHLQGIDDFLSTFSAVSRVPTIEGGNANCDLTHEFYSVNCSTRSKLLNIWLRRISGSEARSQEGTIKARNK
jgi:hypothetical protein